MGTIHLGPDWLSRTSVTSLEDILSPIHFRTELIEVNAKKSGERIGSKTYLPTDKEPDSFDKAASLQQAMKVSINDGRFAITGLFGKECADLWPRIASAANAIV